ncbi:D-aminoacylase [Symmachiella macrocystis]|uniref:D-aminoacylase n=1 Tax=Symmachiella macrocystis TaxID=2527985 RepID=A0A5C6AZZ7_9PLAN|nr:D-aminoacylase [Symmachiella macrocystis]TWU05228.1 D-aminoacylase [Symmachiella macrocystis]
MLLNRYSLLLLLLLGYLAIGTLPAAEPIDGDILLKGGTVFDGSGSPGLVGDVALRGNRIVAVGTFEVGEFPLVIDCNGLVVAPGFIDLHNHSDEQIVEPETRGCVNYLMQGCTTIVTGNCGFGPVNVGEYYSKINSSGAGVNVAHLLPQGSLRADVMGLADRAPTDDELQRMRALAEQAMQDGAWGMTTGLIYVPGASTKTDELVEIAKVIAAHQGFYASHMRDEGTGLLGAVQETLEIGKQAQLPVHVSHFKSNGIDAWGLIRRAAEMIEQAQAEGQKITADQYPYIASSTSLSAILFPRWVRAGGKEVMVKRLDDPEKSEEIRELVIETLKERGERAPVQIGRYKPKPDWVGRKVHEIAQAENRPAVEIVYEIVRNGDADAISFGMNEEDVRFGMQLPWVATASDGLAYLPGADKPHPRSYGTFPRKIGHYAIQEKVIPLAQAIRSCSSLPADILGLADRGRLQPGLVADIVVIDPQTFRDTADFSAPHRYATGIKYVYVAGKPAVFDGAPTGALAGRALNRREAKPDSTSNE